MLKVTINYSELNDGFRIGYFLKALGMVRTENCFWTEIYSGQNPAKEDVEVVLNYQNKPTTPNSEWQQKTLEIMGITLISEPTPEDFKERYGLALVEGNDIITVFNSMYSLSNVFDTWHSVKKHVPKTKIAVLHSKSIQGKSSDKVTLYTVAYNVYTVDLTGFGFGTVGRRFFTNIQDAKEFAKMPLREKPVKRTYTYANAKQIIEEQDQLDDWAQRGYYLPDYE